MRREDVKARRIRCRFLLGRDNGFLRGVEVPDQEDEEETDAEDEEDEAPDQPSVRSLDPETAKKLTSVLLSLPDPRSPNRLLRPWVKDPVHDMIDLLKKHNELNDEMGEELLP